MVKRGGKQVITVEIFKETYDLMKSVAEKKRWNTKEYINAVLRDAIEREKFLRVYAPYLLRIGQEQNTLFIKDSRMRRTAEIHLRDRRLFCSVCHSRDCTHIHYALAVPEIAKLYLRKPGK
jgi:hypothetical protein